MEHIQVFISTVGSSVRQRQWEPIVCAAILALVSFVKDIFDLNGDFKNVKLLVYNLKVSIMQAW